MGKKSFKGRRFLFQYDLSKLESFWTFDDERHIRDLWWNVRKGDVVLDVGSAYGSYALPALACGAAHCFCWSLDHIQEFCQNVELNGWCSKITLVTSGLWSKCGFVKLDEKLMPEFSEEWKEGFFRTTDLDRLDIQKADLLKIDTEGCEVEIIKGARGTIRRCSPKILIERHFFKDEAIKGDCDLLLASLGYRLAGVAGNEFGIVDHAFYTRRA